MSGQFPSQPPCLTKGQDTRSARYFFRALALALNLQQPFRKKSVLRDIRRVVGQYPGTRRAHRYLRPVLQRCPYLRARPVRPAQDDAAPEPQHARLLHGVDRSACAHGRGVVGREASPETGTLRSSLGRQPAAADQAHDPQVSVEWEFLGRRRVSRPIRTGAQALV